MEEPVAPKNDFLSDPTNLQRVVAHDPKLVLKTTKETFLDGEAPEVHLDFRRPSEGESLSRLLESFAEPDFVAGLVTVKKAAEHLYGTESIAADESLTLPSGRVVEHYLLGRVTGMLSPSSSFNKDFGVNGKVYFVDPTNDTIRRGERDLLADDELDAGLERAEDLLSRSARAQRRRIRAAVKRAGRINPDGRAALLARAAERQAEIAQHTQLALEGGE